MQDITLIKKKIEPFFKAINISESRMNMLYYGVTLSELTIFIIMSLKKILLAIFSELMLFIGNMSRPRTINYD